MGTQFEQLTPEERATIMVMSSQQWYARHILHTVYCFASTIYRELKRFASWADRSAFLPAQECSYDTRAAGLRARR
jgi:IS30 family transposase